MAHTIGLDAKMYYDASGVGIGSWTELTNCRDVRLPMSKSEADVTTRANSGWRATAGVLKEATIEWDMVYDPSEAGFTAIQTAFLNDTIIGLAVMDGNIVTPGVEGFQANCEIIGFEIDQSLEEAIKVNVIAKVAYSSTAPSWVTIAT